VIEPQCVLVNLRRAPVPDERLLTQVEVMTPKPGDGFRAGSFIYQYRHDLSEGQRLEIIRCVRAAADALVKQWGVQP
jgi:hypothetical protein